MLNRNVKRKALKNDGGGGGWKWVQKFNLDKITIVVYTPVKVENS
jgi:hypothetical protein